MGCGSFPRLGIYCLKSNVYEACILLFKHDFSALLGLHCRTFDRVSALEEVKHLLD